MSLILVRSIAVGLVLTASAFAQNATVGAHESGLAAVYTNALNGHVTASGQVYHKNRFTAAHKTLPYGTKVRVTNPGNRKSVVVRINDRGPVQTGRILDISPAAASHLGMGRHSMHEVDAEVLAVGSGRTTPQ